MVIRFLRHVSVAIGSDGYLRLLGYVIHVERAVSSRYTTHTVGRVRRRGKGERREWGGGRRKRGEEEEDKKGWVGGGKSLAIHKYRYRYCPLFATVCCVSICMHTYLAPPPPCTPRLVPARTKYTHVIHNTSLFSQSLLPYALLVATVFGTNGCNVPIVRRGCLLGGTL